MIADSAELRTALVDRLTGSGTVRSAWVRAAFAAVPREDFVPRFQVDGHWYDRRDADQRDAWLHAAYTDDALVTQHRPATHVVDPDGLPTSSSTSPTVMAGMLEELDVRPGHRVLEIGTGTGYNTALLCRRVGADHVVSVELDGDLSAAAGATLATLGLHPRLVVGDGAAGAEEHGPFDRVLATASADHVPPDWIDQLTPGGVLVVDLRGSLAGGLVRLVHDGDGTAEGRFLHRPGAFMPLRPDVTRPQRAGEEWDVVFDHLNPHRRPTALDPAAVGTGRADPAGTLSLLIQLHLAGHRMRGFTRTGDGPLTGYATDGSWFEVRPGGAGAPTVAHGGPGRLWDSVESAHRQWDDLGRPVRSRFGVTAENHPDLQFVWCDDPGSGPRWPLPL